MKRRSFIKYTGGSIACGLFRNTALASATKPVTKPLVLGIIPRRNPLQTFKLFTPLANYLSEALGREVKLDTTRSFDDFWQRLKSGRYDLVHYNQYHYIISNILFGHQVILRNHEFGDAYIAGSLMVRNDSDIHSIQQLKQRTILFGGNKMAMQSYIAPKWLLQQSGIDDKDYIERFAINSPNGVISTYNRQADAAACGDVIITLNSVRDNIDHSQMRFLAKTKSLPHLPWAVSPSMPIELKREIQTLLSELRSSANGRLILEQANLTALIPAVDSEYNEHRDMIRQLYGKNFGIEKFT